THELEGFDNLFAVRVLVNLAGGPVGEFVPALCRNRIAEHQRINDPDGSRLHCLECPLSQMDRPDKNAMPLVATMLVSRGLRASVHAARVHRKVTLSTGERPHPPLGSLAHLSRRSQLNIRLWATPSTQVIECEPCRPDF